MQGASMIGMHWPRANRDFEPRGWRERLSLGRKRLLRALVVAPVIAFAVATPSFAMAAEAPDLSTMEEGVITFAVADEGDDLRTEAITTS